MTDIIQNVLDEQIFFDIYNITKMYINIITLLFITIYINSNYDKLDYYEYRRLCMCNK